MAEIASPISGGISAVRNTVSSSVFAGRPTAPTTEPDTITTNLISQNSLTLSTVSQQLSSISENVGRLNFSTIRAATIPMIPGCHFLFESTRNFLFSLY